MKDKGFTLIEIIITIVILGIIGLFSFAFFGSLTRTYTMMSSKTKAHLEAAYAIERISRELRDAKMVIILFNILTIVRTNPTGEDSNIFVMFYSYQNNLYRASLIGNNILTNNLIAKNVTSFTVSPNGTFTNNQKITVTINVTKDGQSQSYTVDVCPKNYTIDINACNFTGRSYGGCYEEKIY